MTTAHRPTFDPAVGKETQKGPAYHQRLLPAHTKLKLRQPGQGGEPDSAKRDLRAELLKAEAAHYAKVKGQPLPTDDDDEDMEDDSRTAGAAKRQITDRMDTDDADGSGKTEEEDESPEAKRRRILEETRDLDADSDSGGGDSDSDSSSSDDSDDEDETAELMRELEKIRRERAEAKEREEREKAAEAEAQREIDIAHGNPLLNPKKDFSVKRRWDDDVIFKNQARGVEEKGKKKEFVNDLLRSDFHKRFMNKYVR